MAFSYAKQAKEHERILRRLERKFEGELEYRHIINEALADVSKLREAGTIDYAHAEILNDAIKAKAREWHIAYLQKRETEQRAEWEAGFEGTAKVIIIVFAIFCYLLLNQCYG